MPLMNFIKIRAKKLYTRISDVFADNRGAGRINRARMIGKNRKSVDIPTVF